ncbi:hypothetical protein [Pseudomonas sp. PI1]|uniref:hypothetical protein n=1 Tax=Pseudomonas sp. PI1 TaxID=1582493 RepID=UPI0012699ED3|nr:hypothetical protein [Pseudomonas sp. PI1]
MRAQAFDFEEVSNLYSEFRIEMRNSSAGKKSAPTRDLIDVIRVRYWYEGLRMRLGLDTPGAIEAKLEPDLIKRRHQSGKSCNSGKWKNFKAGVNTPQNRLVSRLEGLYPGSKNELNHPLWSVLKHRPANGACDEALLLRLSPDIQQLLYKNSPYGWRRTPFSVGLVNRLLRVPSLDALTALVWLLYEAAYDDNPGRVSRLAIAIYRILLIYAMLFQERNLARPLLDYFLQNVLSLDPSPSNSIYRRTDEIMADAMSLHHLALNSAQEKRHKMSWHDQAQAILKLMGPKSWVVFESLFLTD